MTGQTIDHATLSRLVEAGSLRGAHVIGQPGGWSLLVQYGRAERALAAQRSRQVRVFRRMETLVTYLKQVGIHRFDVDATAYETESGKGNARPDRADALRRAHEAAGHDKWFRAQVQIALDEANGPGPVWVSNDDAKSDWAKKRAEIAAKARGRS